MQQQEISERFKHRKKADIHLSSGHAQRITKWASLSIIRLLKNVVILGLLK